MALTSIEILGYRGFGTVGKMDFAIPDGKPGSGLTLITGPNNSGKSSILECLRARNGAVSFTIGTRNAATDSVSIKYYIDDDIETLQSIKPGSSEVNKTVKSQIQFYILPSRRSFSTFFHNSHSNRDDYISGSLLPPQRQSELERFQSRLFSTFVRPDSFDSFNKLLNEIIPDLTWSIDQTDMGQHFLKLRKKNGYHSSDGLGEGIISIFSIVDSLYDSNKGDVIVIDEPELSLHPSLQKKISSIIKRYASDRQIIIATHSPYFVDLEALSTGGHLVRVISDEDGTKIYQLTTDSKTSIAKLISGNLFNPHVFGLDARELFFQEDRVILTEGQEDVLTLPNIFQQLDIDMKGNFFGWGVGGAGNFTYLCKILHDLGYKKVVGILDGNKSHDKINLEKNFCDYLFVCIPADDVRTKDARAAVSEVIGLLDKNRKIRSEFVDGARNIFETVSDFLVR
jgi:predicted ATP-dependent endonuclease of OLD family